MRMRGSRDKALAWRHDNTRADDGEWNGAVDAKEVCSRSP